MPPQAAQLMPNLVALAMFGIGIFLHTRGITLNGQQDTALSQILGGLFDSIGGLVLYFQQLHNGTLKVIKDHESDPLAHFPAPAVPTPTPLEKSPMRNVIPLLLAALCLFGILGCGMSQSYRASAPIAYGSIAQRLDSLVPGTAAAPELRASTQPAPSFPAMQQAWQDAGPVYRQAVQNSSSLNAQRKADWLYTADALDRLNADEAKYEGLLTGGK